MKILVVAARPNELKIIKDGIKSANLKEKLDIDYFCCGVGNYEVISSLERYLALNNVPIFIRNIGICGCFLSTNKVESQLVQIASVINLYTNKEFIIPPFLKIAPLKTCFSGENIVFEKSDISDEICINNDEIYLDMESRGIEFVCSKYKIPRLILRVPFDLLSYGNNKVYVDKINELLSKLPYSIYLQRILDWIKHQ